MNATSRDHFLTLNLRNDPNFRQGMLSNHASMALLALHALGASEQHLERFHEHYFRLLDPLQPDGIDRQQLLDDLRRKGWKQSLAERLPALAEGLGGDAFHGWIRTAYAVMRIQESADDLAYHELTHALAYLERRRLFLSGAPQHTGKSSSELFDKVIAARFDSLPSGLITPRMQKAFASPQVAAAARQTPNDGLAGIAAVVLENFIANADFASLHLVTAVHSSRVLSAWVPHEALIASTWAAVASTLAFVSPRRHPSPVHEPRDWPEIVAAAAESLDDHVPKLVFSCREEARAYPENDEKYRFVARRAAFSDIP